MHRNVLPSSDAVLNFIISSLFIKIAALRFEKGPMNTSGNELPPELVERIERARITQRAMREKDPIFFAAVSGAMFKHDPIGINFQNNTDEYDTEAGTVISRLPTCRSAEDVLLVLHEEFQTWFGSEGAGEIAAYRALGVEIWQLLESRDA
jgi:hypothetical protein